MVKIRNHKTPSWKTVLLAFVVTFAAMRWPWLLPDRAAIVLGFAEPAFVPR